MRYLVVPSCREESLVKFINVWGKTELFKEIDKFIIVWDGPDVPDIEINIDCNLRSYCWRDTDELHGIFSKRDSAIRSFGFYKAYQEHASFVLTMDDDCYPAEGQNILDHFDILNKGVPKCVSTVPGHHIRGLPYHNKGEIPIHINVGLWTGVPDLDAVHQLTHNGEALPLPQGTTVVSNAQMIPMCGMNLSFRREVLPLMYFPLMGLNTPYSRFDDIWAGWIAQRYCSVNGYNISYGLPHVHHSRASNAWVNLEKEAPGLPINEQIWEVISEVDCFHVPFFDYFKKVADQLQESDTVLLPPQYADDLAAALTGWGELFNA